MRSVIISSVLLVIMIVAIAINAYYINSVSTEMLDMIFALPSEYFYITGLDETETEKYKTEINKIEEKWAKNSLRISYVARYSDFDNVNTALNSLKEYFFAGEYAQYLTARKKLISALEKQKRNELPLWENIF